MIPTVKKIIPAETLILVTVNYIKVLSAFEAKQDGTLMLLNQNNNDSYFFMKGIIKVIHLPAITWSWTW